MKCQRCGNEEEMYFYLDNDSWYCRKCIGFGRIDIGNIPNKRKLSRNVLHCHYELNYPLTPNQKQVVEKIMKHLNAHRDVLVYAATGAGKTELTMEAIKTYLNDGKKVGFAISRRQVVLEIQERMQKAFPMLHVIAVCEGYTEEEDGDLIVCTMHQLYRYYQSFDLLIMDEVDAFPYRDNALLETIAMQSCIGEKLMLTATPDEDMLKKVEEKTLEMVELFQRPHGYPLIVPTVTCLPYFMQLVYLFRFLCQQRKERIQTLVFVPTIRLAKTLQQYYRLYFSCITFTSQTKDKEKIIDEFHAGKYEFLISTTVLERGITIKGIHVVIVEANHMVFTEASLIQMIGRVGRNIEMPTGKGVFLCSKKTKAIERCINAIKSMNATMK